jgi:hypothetical protein
MVPLYLCPFFQPLVSDDPRYPAQRSLFAAEMTELEDGLR